MHRLNRQLPLTLLLAIGCGPALVDPGESESGASSDAQPQTDADGTSNGPASTTTSGPPAPTTVASTTTTTTSSTTTTATVSTVTTLPPDDSSGAVSESSESSESSEGGVDSNGFIIDIPDRLGPPCSVWLQDCRNGEKCTPWASDGGEFYNGTRCVPIAASPNGPGEACTVEGVPTSGADDCDAESMCFGVTDDGVGICEPFCAGDEVQSFCTDPGRSCVAGGGGVLSLCLPDCDPLLQGCVADYACYPWDSGFVCAPDDSDGEGIDDVACEYLNDCAAGNMCVAAVEVADCESQFCCTPYCSVAEPNSCGGAGEECVALFGPGQGPPEFSDHGVCSLP